MNFAKVLEHCVKHKFLLPDSSDFSFLGCALINILEKEWYVNTHIQNVNSYLLNQQKTQPEVNKVIQHLANAKSFSECGNKLISLAIKVSSPSPMTIQEVIDIPSLLQCLPKTVLSLCTLIPPSLKMEEFSKLQRKRRLWWKSLSYHPEHLQVVNQPSPEKIDPFVEQRIEYSSSAFMSEPLEVMNLYSPQVFDELSDDLKQALAVKHQKKYVYPWLVISTIRLELAAWYFLSDGLDVRKKSYVMYFHNDVAPYQVGVLIENCVLDNLPDLEDLRRLMSLKLGQSRIPVLPLSNPWTVSTCDARGIPYLIMFDDSTLDNGICYIRSRNTSLKEQVHVADVVPRLKNVLIK